MSNKAQLRDVNNPRLHQIKTAAVGLPTQESMKHGLYVWKRYTKDPNAEPLTVTVQQMTTDAPFNLLMKLNGIDHRTIEVDFWDGVQLTDSPFGNVITFSVSNGTLKARLTNVNYGSDDTYNASWDASTSIISIDTGMNPVRDWTVTLNKTEDVAELLGYVVSDSSATYPDGGTQEGHYYEKVVEGFPLDELGFTKYAVDTFTPTSDIAPYSLPITHGLGEKPKMVVIYSPVGVPGYQGDYTYPVGEIFIGRNLSSNGYEIYRSSGGLTSKTVGITTLNENTITVSDNANEFRSAITYKVVTMA